MLEAYLRRLDELLSTSVLVHDVEIVRRSLPHHLHDGAEDHVVSHRATTGLEALQHILEEIETITR